MFSYFLQIPFQLSPAMPTPYTKLKKESVNICNLQSENEKSTDAAYHFLPLKVVFITTILYNNSFLNFRIKLSMDNMSSVPTIRYGIWYTNISIQSINMGHIVCFKTPAYSFTPKPQGWPLKSGPYTERYKPEHLFCGENSTMGRKPRNSYFERVLASMLLLRMYKS